MAHLLCYAAPCDKTAFCGIYPYMTNIEKKAQLKWHARRGMLELDLILGRFVENHLDSLTAPQLIAFEHLLTQAEVQSVKAVNDVRNIKDLISQIANIEKRNTNAIERNAARSILNNTSPLSSDSPSSA